MEQISTTEFVKIDENTRSAFEHKPFAEAAVKMLSRVLHLRDIKVQEINQYVKDLHSDELESYLSGFVDMPLNTFMALLYVCRMKMTLEPMEINFFNFMPNVHDDTTSGSDNTVQ